MRVIVTGSRRWTNLSAIRRELVKLPQEAVILHGDCAGADALAAQVASELGLGSEAFDKTAEDHARHPQDAWKGLNERMLASGADLVLGFHADLNTAGQALGTRHMLDLAQQADVPVRAFVE